MVSNLITVVIPNYNGIRFIEDCIRSLLEGTVCPRIVVVDNASTDGSCERIAALFPQVTLLRLRVNTGFCHAVNAGLHLVRTPYAMLLNNDTRTERDCLERLLRTMEKSPRIFSVQALMLSLQDPDVVDDAGDLYSALGWAFARGRGKRRGAVRTGRPVHIFAACAGAALYRMEVFERIGWFDERHYCYLEDIDIGWRAQLAGYGNRMEPSAVVYHAGSASTGSRHNTFKETMAAGNNACLLYKNLPFLQYWLNAPLWAFGRAVKRRYFAAKGLGEAYEDGIRRGEALKISVSVQTRLQRSGVPWKRGSLAEEACVCTGPVRTDAAGTGAGDRPRGEFTQVNSPMRSSDCCGCSNLTLDDVIPLYLGAKVPFRMSALPRYLSIQGQLLLGCLRRLWNR